MKTEAMSYFHMRLSTLRDPERRGRLGLGPRWGCEGGGFGCGCGEAPDGAEGGAHSGTKVVGKVVCKVV